MHRDIWGPDVHAVHPIPGNRRVEFIKNVVTRPTIIAGEYSYYDAPEGDTFENRVLYHYEVLGDYLRIGKFCQFAPGVTFIMNGANHKMDGFSTYPFNIFGHGWEKFTPSLDELPFKGDTVVGNDVWIGTEALIMPGVRIVDGAIVAARSVVTRDVPPYAVVGGNPAILIRMRFPDAVITELLQIRWWDWDIQTITAHIQDIVGADLEALRQAALKR